MSACPDRLHRVLEESLERYLNGESIEQCIQRYPAYAEDIRTYLAVAERFAPVKDYEPSAEARERGKQRLLAEWEEIKRRRARQDDRDAE